MKSHAGVRDAEILFIVIEKITVAVSGVHHLPNI